LDGYRHIDRISLRDGEEVTGPTPTFGIDPWISQSVQSISVLNSSFTTPMLALVYDSPYTWQEDPSGTTEFRMSYTSVKKNNYSLQSILHTIEYITLTKETVPYDHYFGGDIFIGKMSHKVASAKDQYVMISAFYESEINIELRHEGLVEPILQGYYKGVIDNSETPLKYAKGFYEADGLYYTRPEFLAYNRDYGTVPDTRPLFPLPFNYNWCSDCGDQYPYRVIASEKSFSIRNIW